MTRYFLTEQDQLAHMAGPFEPLQTLNAPDEISDLLCPVINQARLNYHARNEATATFKVTRQFRRLRIRSNQSMDPEQIAARLSRTLGDGGTVRYSSTDKRYHLTLHKPHGWKERV